MAFRTRDANRLQCNNAPTTAGTGFNIEESLSVVRDFCVDLPQQRIGVDDEYSTLVKTALGDSDMRISVSWTSSSTCEETSSTELVIDQITCEREFYRILDNCGPASSGDLGFYGGSAPNGCGLFSISPLVEEIVRCGGNPSGSPSDMDPEDVEKAIEEHCSQSFELSPAPDQLTTFSLTVPHGQSYNNYLSDKILIRTRAQFSEQAQHDCTEAKAFDTRGDECRRKLRAVMDTCGGEGGGLSENAVNGCVVWTMWGENLR